MIEIPRINTDKAYFIEAIEYTRQQTGFLPSLIEKDYLCSLVLSYLYAHKCPLIFKGGTALNKVHAGFYRLSEDLDFSISIPISSKRLERKRIMVPIKEIFSELHKSLKELEVTKLVGQNESTQYIGEVSYQSALIEERGRIQIEIGLREPNCLPTENRLARTLLVDPLSGNPSFSPFPLTVHSVLEAYSEKLRAALTRREPAIRDLFDVFHAVKNAGLDLKSPDLIALTKKKISVSGNKLLGMTPSRVEALGRQLQAELRPVLHETVFQSFQFDEAVVLLREFESLFHSSN